MRKVLDGVSQNGVLATYNKAMLRLDSYTPLGYSLSGIVIEVGSGASEFEVGQLVACAGNEHALHGEINLGFRRTSACRFPMGSMPGWRRSPPLEPWRCTLFGGQKCSSATRRVWLDWAWWVKSPSSYSSLQEYAWFGLDVMEERCRLAEESGAVTCDVPQGEGMDRIERAIADLSRGLGVDHVFLVAGGQSNGPVVTAARLARDRARVIDVGKLRLDLPWNAFYEKELDVRFSRSYGPGRYDENYELGGIDYPAGYVRWTERRNLQCFVDMLAGKQLNRKPDLRRLFIGGCAGRVPEDPQRRTARERGSSSAIRTPT